MSTRGLKGYINNGEYQAHYIHSDAYPSGLGIDFYKDCKSKYIGLDCNPNPEGVDFEENEISFIKNSLFCEWAYFYDPQTKIFEIWKGFQKFPDNKNPFGFECDESGFYPCRRIFKGDINTIDENIFSDKNKSFIEDILKSIERDNTINKILE